MIEKILISISSCWPFFFNEPTMCRGGMNLPVFIAGVLYVHTHGVLEERYCICVILITMQHPDAQLYTTGVLTYHTNRMEELDETVPPPLPYFCVCT